VGRSAAGRPALGVAESRRHGGKQAVALWFGAAATGWRDEGAGVGDPIYRAAGILGVRAQARAAWQSWWQCCAGDAERKGKKLTGGPGVTASDAERRTGRVEAGRRTR
jgi:hypothetical protein